MGERSFAWRACCGSSREAGARRAPRGERAAEAGERGERAALRARAGESARAAGAVGWRARASGSRESEAERERLCDEVARGVRRES